MSIVENALKLREELAKNNIPLRSVGVGIGRLDDQRGLFCVVYINDVFYRQNKGQLLKIVSDLSGSVVEEKNVASGNNFEVWVYVTFEDKG